METNHRGSPERPSEAAIMKRGGGTLLGLLAALLALLPSARAADKAVGFDRVLPLFTEHCFDCHGVQDPEGMFVMETHDLLLKGGESGPAVVPGKSGESLLVKMIEGTVEKDGKKLVMPPGKRKKLEAVDIAFIRAWIDQGAKGAPEGRELAKTLDLPKIAPTVPVRKAIQAAAYASSGQILALARYGEVELRNAETRQAIRSLSGHRGNVNALAFGGEGKLLFAAAGEAGLFGEVRLWNVADGSLVRTFEGHRDAIYGLALSPDGKTLATGSYDQKIKLWNAETGQELRTLSGHNGCVYALSFRADGKILASASGDRTVKLWDVATGERRDTLSQSLKELYTVEFSPDGTHLAAAGVDNRIRVWEVSEKATETTNPLLHSKFAHEGAVLKIAYSRDGKLLASTADDRTAKIWDTSSYSEKFAFERQPDWAPAATFVKEGKEVTLGRLDGSFEIYDTQTGKPAPLPKPELTRIEPRGVQRGWETKVKLVGKNLFALAEVRFNHAGIRGKILESAADQATVSLVVSADVPRGAYEISVAGKGGESAKLAFHVDDIPQVLQSGGQGETNRALPSLPVAVWGVHDKAGRADRFDFMAKAGQTLVFDLAAKSIGSKADAVLTLSDANGKVLASNNGFDGSPDPFLAFAFREAGRYAVQVSESLLGASADHFYRLSVGEFAYVTSVFPFSATAKRESSVELSGFNIPPARSVKVVTDNIGETDIPLDPDKFRFRRKFKVRVSEQRQFVEAEPNDQPAQATSITVPAVASGRIFSPSGGPDADLFRFEAKAGQTWVIETSAAQRGSPLDTKIEVLHPDERPVQRLLLQAVRNSAVTFRGIDSNSVDCRVENWEEMELNQYLYMQGEVVKLFRAPQGPDSGFNFYSSNGKRRDYFDTSATTHSNEEPCYIVEPHPVGAQPLPNGLPVFPVYFVNDDDAERKLGSDSKLYFTAPADGAYLIRVSDTRGASGDRFVYDLIIREARPDFRVTLNGANPTVSPGSGQSFSVSAERSDGFDEEIKVEIAGLPAGFTASSPLAIQAGHSSASGTIFAAADAPTVSEAAGKMTKVTATAKVGGQTVAKEVNNFGQIKLGEKPKLYVGLEPIGSSASANSEAPMEFTIAPGQIVPATLKVRRNGHTELVTFTVENLPHGIIVDNIGLNGVLIPKDQNEREIFLTAAKWVPETDRLCFAVENQAGRQTSRPVWIHVRKPRQQAAAGK